MVDFGPDILTVTDEDGNEQRFEVIDSIESEENAQQYLAVLPVFENESDFLNDSGELIVLRVIEDGDGFALEGIEDENELDVISSVFSERIAEKYYNYDFDDGSDSSDGGEASSQSRNSDFGPYLS